MQSTREPPVSTRGPLISIRGHPVSSRGPLVSARGTPISTRGPISVRGYVSNIRPSTCIGIGQGHWRIQGGGGRHLGPCPPKGLKWPVCPPKKPVRAIWARVIWAKVIWANYFQRMSLQRYDFWAIVQYGDFQCERKPCFSETNFSDHNMSDCATKRNTLSSFTVYLARNAKLTNCLNHLPRERVSKTPSLSVTPRRLSRLHSNLVCA